MTLLGAILMVGARPIAGVFTSDPAVIDLTVVVIWILGLAHPFMAVEFALGGALRGAGDTVFPMMTVFSGLLVVRVGVATVLVTFFDASIEMVWAVLILDYALKSVMFITRFHRGVWKLREV
jgi:Na+-driven multidrug efflux pump